VTAAVIVLGILCLALLGVLFVRERDHSSTLATQDRSHRDEVREMATRIQHPNLVPRPARPRVDAPPPPDHAQYASIGSVNATPQDGDLG
jgi:hypothetical protein